MSNETEHVTEADCALPQQGLSPLYPNIYMIAMRRRAEALECASEVTAAEVGDLGKALQRDFFVDVILYVGSHPLPLRRAWVVNRPLHAEIKALPHRVLRFGIVRNAARRIAISIARLPEPLGKGRAAGLSAG